MARADVCGLEACSPEFAWQRYGAQAGVAADEFFAYCGSRAKINCISLSNVSQMTGICITAFGVKVAPQNYRFLGP